jgi:hypothetical protein
MIPQPQDWRLCFALMTLILFSDSYYVCCYKSLNYINISEWFLCNSLSVSVKSVITINVFCSLASMQLSLVYQILMQNFDWYIRYLIEWASHKKLLGATTDEHLRISMHCKTHIQEIKSIQNIKALRYIACKLKEHICHLYTVLNYMHKARWFYTVYMK